jgi:hypothetical protein
MNAFRNRRGQFVRNPVSPEKYWNRVSQLVGGVQMRSMAEAQRLAADELRLALVLGDAGEVVDWTEKTGVNL